MKQVEFESFSKEELFEKIKAEYARKAKLGFVMGIVYGLLCLATFIVYCFLTECDSSELLFLSGILLVISFIKFLFSVKKKNIMKAENAEELLSRYDANTKKIGKWISFIAVPYIVVPFIAVPALFLIGYLIYHMITDINIERFGVVLFWLIITFYVLCFILLCFLSLWMMCIPMKGKAKGIGWKDDSIECLRELVANEQQDTL